jgi:hypothetical protein
MSRHERHPRHLGNGLHVLVVENGVVHGRKITEIRDLGAEVEVTEGRQAG